MARDKFDRFDRFEGETGTKRRCIFMNRFLLRISCTTYVTRVTTLSNDRTRVSYSRSNLRIPADFFSPFFSLDRAPSLPLSLSVLCILTTSWRGCYHPRSTMLNFNSLTLNSWCMYIYIYIVKEGQVYLFEWTGILPEQC